MYKKPDNHIQFLEECLNKAKAEDQIKWNSFIEPLPPISKSEGPIHSENVFKIQETVKEWSKDTVDADNNVLGTRSASKPLPPIINKKQLSIEDDHGLTEKCLTPSPPRILDDERQQHEEQKQDRDHRIHHYKEEQQQQQQEQKEEISQPIIFVLGM